MKFATFALAGQREGQTAKEVLARVIDQAQAAEDLGFEAVWVAEHHFTEYGIVPSPAVIGAAIAAKTSTLRIGTGISVLPFHDPRRLAEDYAMLDVLSDGRLDFGVGRGYQPAEFAAMGVDQSESRARFTEAIEIIEGLWTKESFTYHGQFTSFDDLTLYPRPIQSPPPIWMAAVSPESFQLAAESGRPFMSAPQFLPVGKIKDNYESYRRTLLERGTDPSNVILPLSRHIYCGATTEASRDEPADGVMWHQKLNARRMAAGDGSGHDSYRNFQKAQQKLLEITYDELYASGAELFDVPEAIVPRIRVFEEELGLNYMVCWMDFPGTDQALILKSMERFAEEVMPHFAEPTPVAG